MEQEPVSQSKVKESKGGALWTFMLIGISVFLIVLVIIFFIIIVAVPTTFSIENTNSTMKILYQDSPSVPISITIPNGFYTPEDLASTLQKEFIKVSRSTKLIIQYRRASGTYKIFDSEDSFFTFTNVNGSIYSTIGLSDVLLDKYGKSFITDTVGVRS